MPHIPAEKCAKPILDKIRLCTDLLNYERYIKDCAPGAPMCLKPVPDPLAGLPRSSVDAQCLRRSLVPIVFIIGGPGSGKGVQSDLIAKRFGLTHLSVGDLVRQEIRAGSGVGRFVAPIVEAGEEVPKEVILELLKQAMLSRLKTSLGFLIDGFPRDEAQAVAFEEEVARAHLVIYLAARDSTLARRLAGRGREDADEDVAAERLRVFHRHTEVLKRAFGRRCKVVSAEGEPLAVFAIITGHLCSMANEWGFRTAYEHCPKGYVPLHRLQRK
ncbi:adenylate kinase isoenzyme 1-like [Thrips palmi]|uniref:Adenylate kinase isoenzyme 1-like n=1 Tax=Thrips palmi TaxID=161013 RepID=A0A6P8YGA4_THRPL|nr:adenylate kinase isoenzyme 1-like [Thrips palmi]